MRPMRTLVVLHASRRLGDTVLQDHIHAIRWSLQEAEAGVLVVDTRGVNDELDMVGIDYMLPGNPAYLSGFNVGLGLAAAIKDGWDFKQVIALKDTCLPIGQFMDTAVETLLGKYDLDLLGQEDVYQHLDAYETMMGLLHEWSVPNAGGAVEKTISCRGFYAMSNRFVRFLADHCLLVPVGAEKWGTLLPNYGPFISWTAQLNDFTQATCGKLGDPWPPVFWGGPTCHMPPYHLAATFKLYGPVDTLPACPEPAIREHYAKARQPHG